MLCCQLCDAIYHAECARTHGRCVVVGCPTVFVKPEPVRPPGAIARVYFDGAYRAGRAFGRLVRWRPWT